MPNKYSSRLFNEVLNNREVVSRDRTYSMINAMLKSDKLANGIRHK